MKLPSAIITGPGAEDGYYLGIISTTGQTVTGVSIFQDALSAGTTVSVIQCGRDDNGDAEYGFALQSRGLESVTEIPTSSNPVVFAESPYSSATAAIGHFAGMVRSLYLRAAVSAINALSLSVTLEDGPWKGNTIVAQVAFENSLVASDFSVGERVLLRNWPDREPVVVGWWESAPLTIGIRWRQDVYDTVRLVTIDGYEGTLEGTGLDYYYSMETAIPTKGIKRIGPISGASPNSADIYVVGHGGDTAGKTMRGCAEIIAGKAVWRVLRSDVNANFDKVYDYTNSLDTFGPVPLDVPFLLPRLVDGYLRSNGDTGYIGNSTFTGNWAAGGDEGHETAEASVRFHSVGSPDASDYVRYLGF